MAPNRLTQQRIIEAATEVIEAGGAKAFSMRKLAEKLRVDPMAVYHYFPNKDLILHGVLENVMASIDLTIKGDDWKQDVIDLCQAFRSFAVKHPEVYVVFVYHSVWVRKELDLHEAFYGVFLRAGLSGAQVVKSTLLIVTFLEEFIYSDVFGYFETESEAEYTSALGDGDYPLLRSMTKDTISVSSSDVFRFALDVILAGLEAQRPRGV